MIVPPVRYLHDKAPVTALTEYTYMSAEPKYTFQALSITTAVVFPPVAYANLMTGDVVVMPVYADKPV